MTEYEAYQEHIRYTHDTYCRIVIRHASFDAARMLAARWKREISLEYLTEEKFVPLSTTDEYFQVPDYGETYPFSGIYSNFLFVHKYIFSFLLHYMTKDHIPFCMPEYGLFASLVTLRSYFYNDAWIYKHLSVLLSFL